MINTFNVYLLLLLFVFRMDSLESGPKDSPLPCFRCDNSPPGTIFCDDFESGSSLSEEYFEYDSNEGNFTRQAGAGRHGSYGMEAVWEKGQVHAGALRKSIGRIPGSYMSKNASFPHQDFTEIYWKVDVLYPRDWKGNGPAKLSRATVMADSQWQQGMIAHIWSGGSDNKYLVMDPASGISPEGDLRSTKYNDFENLRWLGHKVGPTNLFSGDNLGKWHCIVAHTKLNTPGKSDGVFEFWIDGEFQAGTYDLNWHGDWNSNPDNYFINAVFFENYWNSGSPVRQKRYIDNILISEKPVSCDCK